MHVVGEHRTADAEDGRAAVDGPSAEVVAGERLLHQALAQALGR